MDEGNETTEDKVDVETRQPQEGNQEDNLRGAEISRKLLHQKQREIEQQNISPDEIVEEKEKRQPQSGQEE